MWQHKGDHDEMVNAMLLVPSMEWRCGISEPAISVAALRVQVSSRAFPF